MARFLIGNIKGPKGDTGAKGATGAQGATGATGATGPKGATGTRGSMWYRGTGITGTSTTATVFSGSGVSSALVNDMYLNTSTSYVYQCTTAGAASAAKWVYIGSIKGATGATGPKGATGAQGPQGPAGTTPSTSTMFLAAHPVGAIFSTNVHTNPGSLYGGTWREIQSADSFKYIRTK